MLFAVEGERTQDCQAELDGAGAPVTATRDASKQHEPARWLAGGDVDGLRINPHEQRFDQDWVIADELDHYLETIAELAQGGPQP